MQLPWEWMVLVNHHCKALIDFMYYYMYFRNSVKIYVLQKSLLIMKV